MTHIFGNESTCAGCSDPLVVKGCYRGHRIELAPDLKAHVCKGRYGASAACEDRARRNAHVCPACGKTMPAGQVGQVCRECLDALSVGRAHRDARRLVWWGIDPRTIAENLRIETQGKTVYPVDELAVLLGRAMGEGRSEQASGAGHYIDPDHWILSNRHRDRQEQPVYLEATQEAGEALRAFVLKLAEVMRLQYADGYQDGSDLLGRLNAGDVSARDFEDRKHSVDYYNRKDRK